MIRVRKIKVLLSYLLGSCGIFAVYLYHGGYTMTSPTDDNLQQPNIVFILTDDQDQILTGMLPIMQTFDLIGKKGIMVNNSFATTPLSCPSRSSILTGQYVHNHGAINNSISGQCSGKLWQSGPETRTLAVHLHDGGYKTFYAGKYLNKYGSKGVGGVSHIPPGWDWWNALKGNSVYYNYTLSINGTAEVHGNDPQNDYLTNVIKKRAKEFLDGVTSISPFFMMLATPAAHAPFTPEPKYAANFSDLNAPRTENFNIPAGPNKHWLLRQGEQPLPDDIIEKVDEVYRNRMRTLLTVDDLVRDVISQLDDKGVIDNTYIFFSSDNGYHLGQFSLPIDKREPYEFDIRVPLMIRGPGIQAGSSTAFPVNNVDLAPTFLDIAGLPIPSYMDGQSILQKLKNVEENKDIIEEGRTVLVTHSGEGYLEAKGCPDQGAGFSSCNPDFDCRCQDSWNNTYACIRTISSEKDEIFCRFEDDEDFEEAYDLKIDKYQLNNIAMSIPSQKRNWLKKQLNDYTSCAGDQCSNIGQIIF